MRKSGGRGTDQNQWQKRRRTNVALQRRLKAVWGRSEVVLDAGLGSCFVILVGFIAVFEHLHFREKLGSKRRLGAVLGGYAVSRSLVSQQVARDRGIWAPQGGPR